ncbi:hypothetical protein QQ045_009956 [Rhodiola kirilowii]
MDLWNSRPKIAAAIATSDEPPHLPDDIIFIILTRLPAKYVLRFRSVSKLWNTLILSQRFITRHHYLTANPITFLTAFPVNSRRSFSVVWISIDREAQLVRVDRDAYDRKSIREFTCAPHIVGDSCDGVFCVEYRKNAALWNPATREMRVVELDYGRWFDLDSKLVRWVGFGSVKDERSNVVNFKLLLVVTDNEEDEEEEAPIVHILVYSLRANSLNLVKFPCFLLRNISHNGSVSLDGVLHWLAKGGEGAETAYILTFDLVSETFTKIDLPCTDWIDIQDKNHYFLTVLDNQYLSFGMVDQAARCLNTWALHEINGQRSWIRREKIGPLMKAGLMVKYCDPGVITQADLDGRFWYHGQGNASKHDTGLYGLTNWFEYSESLVSLKRIANGYNLEDKD